MCKLRRRAFIGIRKYYFLEIYIYIDRSYCLLIGWLVGWLVGWGFKKKMNARCHQSGRIVERACHHKYRCSKAGTLCRLSHCNGVHKSAAERALMVHIRSTSLDRLALSLGSRIKSRKHTALSSLMDNLPSPSLSPKS